MLLNVAQAMKDANAGNTAKAESETAEALQSLDTIQTSMHEAEYGKWKNWYRGDWLTGIYRTRRIGAGLCRSFKGFDGEAAACARGLSGWEAYFHIMRYEGDRSVDVH